MGQNLCFSKLSFSLRTGSELKPLPLSTDVLGGTLMVNFPTVFGCRIGSEVGNEWGTGVDDVDAVSVSSCWMEDGIRKWI